MRALLLLLVASTLWAADRPWPGVGCPVVWAAFEQSNQQKYQEGYCYDNVFDLIDRLKKGPAGYDPAKAQVLYLYRSNHEQIPFYDSRNPDDPTDAQKQKLWTFHVAFKYDGVIYDFDHGQEPVPVPEGKYYEKAILRPQGRDDETRERNRNKLLNTVRVRSIPADEYLRDFNQRVDGIRRGSSFYWAYPIAEKTYPSVPLKDVVK